MTNSNKLFSKLTTKEQTLGANKSYNQSTLLNVHDDFHAEITTQIPLQEKIGKESTSDFNNFYMKMALEEACLAYAEGEIPVGCVIIDHTTHTVISNAHNMSQQGNNPNLHAEMIAIDMACKKINNKTLSNCDIYITLEPCTMCASAISNARIARMYYAASDKKQGAVENGVRFYTTNSCFYRPEIYSDIQRLESETIITSFFSKLRKNKL